MVGAKDRDTNFVSAAVVEHTNQETLQGFVTDHSNEDATVYTDEGLPRSPQSAQNGQALHRRVCQGDGAH